MVWQKGYKLQGGRYVIEKVLGEGGFGITYQAQHTLLNQWVVIKTPNESLKNDSEYPNIMRLQVNVLKVRWIENYIISL
jgi:serine/threonine-protein kinase